MKANETRLVEFMADRRNDSPFPSISAIMTGSRRTASSGSMIR